jgi:hypothetical protein
MRRRSEVQSGRYGGCDYRWVADWQSVQSGLITCWNIWIDRGEDCIGLLIQSRGRNILSIYNTPEGLARGKGRKTVSRVGARRLGRVQTPPHLRTPPLVSHVRTPPHLRTPPYSDTSPRTEDAKEHRRKRNGQYRNKQQQEEKY